MPQIYSGTPATPVVLPAAQRDTYVQPPQSAPPQSIPAQAFAALPVVPSYAVQPTYTVTNFNMFSNQKRTFLSHTEQINHKLIMYNNRWHLLIVHTIIVHIQRVPKAVLGI